MWVMTSFGILMPTLRPPQTVPKDDPRTVQIRARVAGHLDVLRERYMPATLGPTIELPNTDYEFRAYCTPVDWATALAQISLEIDYVKFKPTAEGHALHTLYNRIWAVMFEFMSTPKHRSEYWSAQKVTTTTVTTQRLGRVGEWEIDWGSDADLEVNSEWDDDWSSPITRASGQLDHRSCAHATTKGARRRCRRRWLNRNR